MKPNSIPGINYASFTMVQLFSRMMSPTMMMKQKYLQIPILPPLTDYHTIANKIPPEPFHPTKILSTIAAQKTTHITLSLRSLVTDGRQGISQYRRRMARQLYKKDTRQPTKKYCRMGIEKYFATWMCPTTRRGARMMRVRVENVIFGSFEDYLYQKSCQSIPATMEASRLIFGTMGGRSLSLINLSLMLLLVIQINYYRLSYTSIINEETNDK